MDIIRLAYHGVRALHDYRRDRTRYTVDALRRRGIPQAALLDGPPPPAHAAGPTYNALRPKDRGLMLQSLLSGVGIARRVPAVTQFPPGQARDYLNHAIAAYDGLTQAQRNEVDRCLLSRRGIPRAARVPRGPAYEGMDSERRMKVRMHIPGAPTGYLLLNENAQAIVDRYHKRGDKIYELLKPILPEDLREYHYPLINPNRRYKYPPLLGGPEVVRSAMMSNKAVMDNTHDLLVRIKTIPAPGAPGGDRYPEVRRLYVGEPEPRTAANPNANEFPTVANPNGAEGIRQMVFAMERTWVKVVEEKQRVIERMIRLYKNIKKYLSKHFWHVAIWGKTSYSAFMDAAKTYVGKMWSGSGYFNEPYIGRQAQPINFLQD